MTEIDKSTAYSILGLLPGASHAQIDVAHKKLIAFFVVDESSSGSLTPLIEPLREELEAAYKLLTEDHATGAVSPSTVSGTTQKHPQEAPGRTGRGVIWAIVILLFCGVWYQMNQKAPVKPPDIFTPDPQSSNPTPQETQPPAPDQPPGFIAPFIHDDDVKGLPTRWTSGWEDVDGAQRMTVWAYAANNDPVYKFEMYSDNGKWREWRHYVIRYSTDRRQISVQRYQERGAVPEFKDKRNVSDKGDVHVQTTTYLFSAPGVLDSVKVETPFIADKGGLKIHREDGSVFAEQLPTLNNISLENSAALSRSYDLWSTFGEPNI
jgi:hypothetical protein